MREFTRSRQFLNPDEDFVLHGQRASYSEKPLGLRNSRLTNTTSRLSQHILDQEDNYRDRRYAESLGDLAKSLENTSKNVDNTLRRSVTFSGHHLPYSLRHKTPLEEEYDKIRDRKLFTESFGGLPVDDGKELWYTKPVHLNRQEYFLSPRHGASSRSRSPHKNSGTIGAALALQDSSRVNYDERNLSLSSKDSMGLKFFPVTLQASYELSDLDRKLEELENKPRPRTANSYVKTSYEPDSVNSMYLLGSEAPVTRKSSPLYTSPYVSDLSSLRMERLRIEEDRYLELKRLQELERLRGPHKKWYESTGPDFHYESHKNTEMIKSEKHFDKLLQYKEDLNRSSADCRKSYEAICV
ncbi:uncharacterized protein LOC127724015 [Mytilus californianus]|uniref:uncharacterized protein LOC127724015 n=1 Tax=Mytilus californianus TaxID=6549 RepID=UPI0022462D95|nr:uncharacterized protein LOC127724015 [Mytilus californianus]